MTKNPFTLIELLITGVIITTILVVVLVVGGLLIGGCIMKRDGIKPTVERVWEGPPEESPEKPAEKVEKEPK